MSAPSSARTLQVWTGLDIIAFCRTLQMAFAPWLHETDGTFEDKKRLKALLQREAEQGTYRKQA